MGHKHGDATNGSTGAVFAARGTLKRDCERIENGHGREKWSMQKGPNPLLLMGLDRS
jgi:hypothetical protein